MTSPRPLNFVVQKGKSFANVSEQVYGVLSHLHLKNRNKDNAGNHSQIPLLKAPNHPLKGDYEHKVLFFKELCIAALDLQSPSKFQELSCLLLKVCWNAHQFLLGHHLFNKVARPVIQLV